VGKCPFSTLQCSMPHVSHCWKPSPLQAFWGEGLLNPPSLAGLFIYSLRGEVPSPLSGGVWHTGKGPFSFLQSSGHPALFATVLFQLLVYYSGFFSGVGVSLSRRLCWFIPGLAVGVPWAAYLLTCWSASPKHVRSWCLAAWEPFLFLRISWCGEVMCGLRVWRCQSFASFWWFFLPGVSPVSQQDFYFKEHMLSASSF
jgi:hypothetical protein